jgi:hypothetical protein
LGGVGHRRRARGEGNEKRTGRHFLSTHHQTRLLARAPQPPTPVCARAGAGAGGGGGWTT